MDKQNSLRELLSKKLRSPGVSRLGCLINLNYMFKLLDGAIGAIVLILILKWAMPQEVGDLVSEILIKGLTLINDLLTQVAI